MSAERITISLTLRTAACLGSMPKSLNMSRISDISSDAVSLWDLPLESHPSNPANKLNSWMLSFNRPWITA
eukprot:5778164-Amphidinium_carterae.1